MKKQPRRCTKDKTYGGALCSMDLAVVFHPPPPGGRIQIGKLVSPKKDPPREGRACASLYGKVCTEHQIVHLEMPTMHKPLVVAPKCLAVPCILES
jgi:hypothetical protein